MVSQTAPSGGGSLGRSGLGASGEGRFVIGAFVVYAVLAVAMTWPLARAPHRLLHGNADVYGNVWAMSWVAHQLPRDPWRLFDSNMYFPHTKSLAYAESLLPQGLQALVVSALGGPPALAYNLALLLSFPVAGLGAALLARELGASRSPAAVCGLGFAFCAYRWDHLVHLQSLSCGWLPLALWCLLRTLRAGATGPFRWPAVGLGVFAWLQVLSSGYYALLVAAGVAVAAGIETWRWRRDSGRLPPGLSAAVVALGLAALAAAPVFLQHREVMRRHGFRRSVAEMRVWSAGPRSWLDPGPFAGLPHTRWLHARFEDREPLFPGSVFLLGGLGGLGLAVCRRNPGATLCAALAALGALLASGAEWSVGGVSVPGPFALVRLLPGGELLRTPSRFGVLGILGLDLLAALALTAGMERLASTGSRRSRVAVGLLATLGPLAVAEAWPVAIAALVKPAPPEPPAASWLRSAPPGVVLELPWTEVAQSAVYVYWSTSHWQRLVNGYGSFDPPGNFALGLLGQRFPTEYTARQLRAAGVRYVVVHTDRLDVARRDRLREAPLPSGVRVAAELGPDRIYEISGGAPP